MTVRSNIDVIRAFGSGQKVEWKYSGKSLDGSGWHKYDGDGGPMLGSDKHQTTQSAIEWRVGLGQHRLPIDKNLINAFADGIDLQWRTQTSDWSLYRGGICLTKKGVDWSITP